MLSLDERRITVITTQTSGREVHQCTRLPCLAYCMVQSPVIGLCGHDYFKICSAGWSVIFPGLHGDRLPVSYRNGAGGLSPTPFLYILGHI
jgi:hypothetical protein